MNEEGEKSPSIFTLENTLKTANQVGISTIEFWQMTMKELQLYIEGYKENFKLKNNLSDRRTARICMVLANLQRDPRRKSKPYKEDDFIPKEKKPMTIEQLELFLKAITMACGGDIENG